MDPHSDTVEQYRDFATDAADYSPCFQDWASRLAEDVEVLKWLADLPVPKRQPNLVFAAARWHGVAAPGPYEALRRALLDDDGSIRATIRARSTQTNEVGRLATLVPAFALLAEGEPLALLEVGASAGLCLYPDRYSYLWNTDDGLSRAGAGPELSARVTGPAPLPDVVPSVAWRSGVDLHPVDVTDDDQVRWLSFLVWPEHDERRARLARAVEVARAEPPQLTTGDLIEELPPLVETGRRHGRLVVFHSAVAAYLTPENRDRFHRLMTALVADGQCRWVSNEAPDVLPAVTSTGAVPDGHRGFVLGIDGQAVGLTHGHGRSLEWL